MFVNIAATFSVFLIMSFDCMDYSFEVMGLSLRQRIQFVRQNGVSYFGHGSFLAVTSLIPGLTILLLPYGVLGAAELIARAKNEYPTA